MFYRRFERRRLGSQMYKAVCNDCGGDAFVPFKPTAGRPVYCRKCFPKHRETLGYSRYRGARFPRVTELGDGPELKISQNNLWDQRKRQQ